MFKAVCSLYIVFLKFIEINKKYGRPRLRPLSLVATLEEVKRTACKQIPILRQNSALPKEAWQELSKRLSFHRSVKKGEFHEPPHGHKERIKRPRRWL